MPKETTHFYFSIPVSLLMFSD